MKQLYQSLAISVLCLLCCLQPLSAQDSGRNYIRVRTMLDSTGVRRQDAIRYFDGLGRPYLSVEKNQSPSGGNLATLLEYDNRGNESINWLPGVVKADYIAPSLLKDSLALLYQGDSRPYEETAYEPSLLSKVSRIYRPGAAWQEHPARVEYYVNCDSFPLSCTNYSISADGSLTSSPANECKYKVEKSVDEDGGTIYTFTNGLGNEVLVRRMEGEVGHDTYYVYDSYDLLRYVLPPAYQEHPDLARYAYRYAYDSLGRCVEKQLPGCSAVRYVYDAADHLTFSQDGNQRDRSEWTFYLYDAFGRVLVEGACINPDTSSIADKVVKCFVSRNADRQMTPGYGLWNTPYIPNITLPSASMHVVNYYDDYSFRSLPGFSSGFTYKPGNLYAKGQLTGSMLSGGTRSVFYYDAKGQLSGSRSINSLYGSETTSYSYTFTGKPLTLSRVYESPGGSSINEAYAYTYDNAERQTDVRFRLNDGPSLLLYRNVYDELGRLQRREYMNPSDSTRLVTSSEYAYNIRNWLTSIAGDKFSQSLNYTDGPGAPCYNGNISSMSWQGGTETTTRGYKFTYDDLSRLKDAIYGEGTAISLNANRFNEQVTGYDKMGNILGLKRYGQTSTTGYNVIDDLSLTYQGNQLKKVTDSSPRSAFNGSFEFKDGANAATEYEYDENGNLTKDLNKKIADIQYNYLNLPVLIQFEDGNSISYVYDANGTKLRTTHLINGVTTTTDYCGNVIYENGVAKTLLTEVGYVSLADNKYHYFVQDHQGNNRVVVDQNGSVEEVNHYYPFGGVFANSQSVQPCKYNGKELDRKGGLDWYDYGARYYDASIGRFMKPDRFSEKYVSLSPYQYGANNPVNNIDINGDSITVLNYGYRENQHMALLIQNAEGKWQYFSVNGDNVYVSGRFSGGRKFNDVGIGSFNTPEEFLRSNYNSSGKADDVNVNSYGFSEGYVIPTSKKQDNVIRDTFKKIVNDEEYHLMFNNCATVVQRAIEAAGVATHVGRKKTFSMPSTNYLPKVNPFMLHNLNSRSIVPSIAFESIIQLNPNGKIVNK